MECGIVLSRCAFVSAQAQRQGNQTENRSNETDDYRRGSHHFVICKVISGKPPHRRRADNAGHQIQDKETDGGHLPSHLVRSDGLQRRRPQAGGNTPKKYGASDATQHPIGIVHHVTTTTYQAYPDDG